MNSEKQRQEAFKLFLEAWALKESEISSTTDKEISKLETEIQKLKKDITSTESKILILEQENDSLQQTLSACQSKNESLQSFKENLKKSLSYERPVLKPPLPSSIDGKAFFREAKNRLSYESFSVFSSYVKKLNDRTISKEKALDELQQVFGDENGDLFEDFSNLLLRKPKDYDFK